MGREVSEIPNNDIEDIGGIRQLSSHTLEHNIALLCDLLTSIHLTVEGSRFSLLHVASESAEVGPVVMIVD